MPVSAHDVAAELRHRLPGVGDLKIHKLLYYCQGWYYAWTGRPMFHETIEAWTNGPVVADLWRAEAHDSPRPSPSAIDEDMSLVIDSVLGRYGVHSGANLIILTHDEDPWIDAMEIGQNTAITPEAIGTYMRRSPDQVEMRAIAADLRGSGRLQEAVEAISKPSETPEHDDSEDLARLLDTLI